MYPFANASVIDCQVASSSVSVCGYTSAVDSSRGSFFQGNGMILLLCRWELVGCMFAEYFPVLVVLGWDGF